MTFDSAAFLFSIGVGAVVTALAMASSKEKAEYPTMSLLIGAHWMIKSW